MRLGSTKSSERLIALGVCVFAFACLIPIIIARGLWQGQEIWILEAIKSVHRSFHLVPRIGGNLLFGHNPLAVLLFSLVPGDNVVFFRIFSLILGLLVTGGVFVYCSALWDRRAGFWAGLFTVSSFGFLAAYSSLNMEVIPCTFALLSFMVFSLAYLRFMKGYVFSYALACLAFVTGGWIPLMFVFFGIVLLILFNLSLEKFFEIRALRGALIFFGAWIIFYFIYRIAGGSSFVSRALSHGSGMGFWASLWAFIKATLPWLPLLIPAWIYEVDPEGEGEWKKLLPAKIGFGLTFLILWFSEKAEPGYSLLAVPFMAMLIGYWVSRKMEGIFSKMKVWVIILSGITIIGAGIVVMINREFSLLAWKGILFWGLVLFGSIVVWLMKKDKFTAAILIEIVAVIVVIMSYSFIYLSYKEKVENPLAYVESIVLSHRSYLVFEDDLHMRGYLAHAGAKNPILVDEKFRPLGENHYLAVSTEDKDALMDDLEERMDVEIKSSFEADRTYALLFVSPKDMDR